jgi:hypothetical protein
MGVDATGGRSAARRNPRRGRRARVAGGDRARIAADALAGHLASEDIALYAAEAPLDAQVEVDDDEHDRFLWLTLADALPKCLPPLVASGLANAAAWIEGRTPLI